MYSETHRLKRNRPDSINCRLHVNLRIITDYKKVEIQIAQMCYNQHCFDEYKQERVKHNTEPRACHVAKHLSYICC